eukprot:TRINITY_DN1047_c0_g1_i4.p1 TRINITY_DN1047_c0_g1~~TRINITY_DN1047_c0_g1_i4.p1  ORF type:complete len:551 (-),score=111.04 TRINITY_DN1047_c0_g1_i4:250-1902(-)
MAHPSMDIQMAAYQQQQAAEVDRGGPPEIRPEEITLEELIGTGSFGKVYKGRCRQKAVAVKILHKQQFDPATLAAFRKEVHLMSKIFHPNICLFMGACTIPGKCMIVTELVPKGNLETMLHDEKLYLPLSLRMRAARDAALGVNWLHESNPVFIHRDLKSSNLLVDENMRVKICDFGLSAVKQRHQMMKDQTSAKGTPLYMAPEVMMFREFNESSDVYSFGIVLWEILTRKEPFSHFRELEAFRTAVCVNHERPPIPPATLESLRRLIERCWDKEPARRPSFREIICQLEHVIVESAISDRRGREFWKQHFLTEYVVGWDAFIDALCDWLRVPNRSQCDKGSLDYLNLKCIKAILAEAKGDGGGENVVSVEKFGRILEYFGPLQPGHVPTHDPSVGTILDRIRELLAQKWFHGDLDTADAAARLAGQNVGTFLIRFSNTSPGCFTISLVSEGATIRHQRVQYQAGKGFLFNSVLYPSLQALVAPLRPEVNSCPNYKFLSIFCNIQQTPVIGYPLDQYVSSTGPAQQAQAPAQPVPVPDVNMMGPPPGLFH